MPWTRMPLKMTSLARSQVTGPVGMPNSVTRPPFFTERKAWCKAVGCPDISNDASTPSPLGDLENRCGDGVRAVGLGVEYVIDAHLFGQAQAVITDVGGDNGGGSGGAGDGGGEQAGRAAAGDQDGVAGQVFHEGRIDGIAQRFLQASQLRRNVRGRLPEHGFREHDVVGKRAIQIDAENPVVLAHVGLAGAALKAGAAGQMRFGRDIVAHASRGVTSAPTARPPRRTFHVRSSWEDECGCEPRHPSYRCGHRFRRARSL
jgi:hypothetical protein